MTDMLLALESPASWATSQSTWRHMNCRCQGLRPEISHTNREPLQTAFSAAVLFQLHL